ncbi:MAG: hypothetical protein EOO72_10860, partial [Myxococcaceae bacterium]
MPEPSIEPSTEPAGEPPPPSAVTANDAVPVPGRGGGAVAPVSLAGAREASSSSEEGRFAFLARAGEVLSSSLDEPTVLRQLAELVVPVFADWCAVDLVTPSRTVVRRAAAHRDPSLVP